MERNFSTEGLRKREATLILCLLIGLIAAISGCSSQRTDPRSLIPQESLIYLETRDLGATLRAITGSARFADNAVSVPDLRGLDGISMSVAVTGFETSEQIISEESAVLNFQPRFVAVAETGYWQYQVTTFVEERLGLFISEAYGGEASLETTEKHGGKFYVWTALDGRKAYGLVLGSLVLFGNDESAIEKSLAVKRGELEPITRNPKITDGDRLAFGYVSPDGVAQLANIAGVSMAKQAGEEAEIQSFVARALPELIRNSIRELTWTAERTGHGIEDKYAVATDAELASVFAETLVPSKNIEQDLYTYLPPDVRSLTRYGLEKPQVAWRSVLFSAQSLMDQNSGAILNAFSDSLFQPYGVEDGEAFLSAAGSTLVTAVFDDEGEKAVTIVRPTDVAAAKRALAREFNFAANPERIGVADVWKVEDEDLAAAVSEGVLIVGDRESVLKCIEPTGGSASIRIHPSFGIASESDAVSATIGTDVTTGGRVIDVISDRKNENAIVPLPYMVEMRFNRNGMERRVVSDFGFLGLLIAQFAQE